jgi:DtxR family Mn-dependent transcriptional regulator
LAFPARIDVEDIVSDLIDTTEMYLRTIFELEEEGVIPMRARIAERLSQSGPTVSQTVARMERDGLVVVTDDRSLALTEGGRETAMRVMRKHRDAVKDTINSKHVPTDLFNAAKQAWDDAVELGEAVPLARRGVSTTQVCTPTARNVPAAADCHAGGAAERGAGVGRICRPP